jgi:hypothetical protein
MTKLTLIIVALIVGFASWYGYEVISMVKENAAQHAQQLKAINQE